MAAETGRLVPRGVAPRVAPARRASSLGSVFGKTVRDSRWGILAITAVLGLLVVAGGGTMASTYGTPEARSELSLMARTLPPALVGIYGDPRNVDTLGGFVSWHYGAYFALLTGLWSILALSSTLAAEARRGSLELVAVTSVSRRRLAIEKLLGHVVAVALAMGVVGILAWITGAAFARFEGDAIAPGAAAAFVVGVGLKALVPGSLAFAIAPIVGRAGAAGVTGALMLAAYVLNSYRTVVAAFDGPASLGWFAWSRNHVPLAGNDDWPSMALVALVAVILFGVGIEVFQRSDIGAPLRLPALGMPDMLSGVRGPVGRTLAELLPAAAWWGIGLGLYGLVMAASSTAIVEELARSRGLVEAFRGLIPGMDLGTTAGFLQFLFVDLGLLLVGLAAATLVSGWAGDESSGRLELLLTTPLARARWLIAGGLAVWMAVGVTVGIVAVALGVGVAATGEDPVRPVAGMLALALYGCAMAGTGLAIGGLLRTDWAAPTVAAIAIGMFLLQVLGPVLRLPAWVQELALSGHLGRPLVGAWDPAGLAACLALAVGGAIVGALGVRRRDVRG